MTLHAGQHPVPLDELHATMGADQLRRHLALDHSQPVDRRLGPGIAQHTHRLAHEEAP